MGAALVLLEVGGVAAVVLRAVEGTGAVGAVVMVVNVVAGGSVDAAGAIVGGLVDVEVTVGCEVVGVLPQTLTTGSLLFVGSLMTMGELSFPLLFTKHIMSTPIAVVIAQAERQARKLFHRDQVLH